MTSGFSKSLFLLFFGTAFALSACNTTSGPVSIVKVNPYHLDTIAITRTDDRMIEFEDRRRLYGAVTSEDYREISGQYYSVFWKSKDRNPATVRFEFRQSGSGPKVYSKEILVSRPKRSNVTKFEVTGSEYLNTGKVTQWKASIIESGVVVAEYRSFLWKE